MSRTADFYMKQNDRLPEYEEMLKGDDGEPLVLTGATVTFVMARASDGTVKVNAAATIVEATLGKVKYSWAAGDTDMAGENEKHVYYDAEWHVTLSGKTIKVPNDGHIRILITRALA